MAAAVVSSFGCLRDIAIRPTDAAFGDASPRDGASDRDGGTSIDADDAATSPDVDAGVACAMGTTMCDPSGEGVLHCGKNSRTRAIEWGAMVPCRSGEVCDEGVHHCVRRSCGSMRVIVALDRSSSMITQERWTWTHAVLVRELAAREQQSFIGFRTFPVGNACGVGAIVPVDLDATAAIDRAMVAPTEGEGGTPLAATLADLPSALGDPIDGRAVFLVTDGTEECAAADDAVARASELFHAGIHTFVFGIATTAAQTSELDRIAIAGGTGRAMIASNARLLADGIDEAFRRFDVCTDPRLTAGSEHTCAISVDGTVSCWGRDYENQAQAPSGRFVSIEAGGNTTCGLRPDGRAECWGATFASPYVTERFTQLSLGRLEACGVLEDKGIACWTDRTNEPEAGEFLRVASGSHHACGIAYDGSVSCWGDDGTYGETTPPDGERFIDIAPGELHTCGIRIDGTITCFGDNSMQQRDAPNGIFTDIDAGRFHTCAVASDRSVACWGQDVFGEASGQRGPYDRVTAGDNHTCAIATDGLGACWGDNSRGQLGPN